MAIEITRYHIDRDGIMVPDADPLVIPLGRDVPPIRTKEAAPFDLIRITTTRQPDHVRVSGSDGKTIADFSLPDNPTPRRHEGEIAFLRRTIIKITRWKPTR